MTSPGGREVGRVSVRVVPKTDNFRKELKRDLEEETRGLEAEVDVEFDSDGLRQRLKAIVAQASRGVEAKVGVDFDEAEIRRIGNNLNQSLNKSMNRGRSGGGNVLTRSLIGLPVLINQVRKDTVNLFRAFARGYREGGRSVIDLSDALRDTGERARAVRESLDDYNNATSRARDNLQDVRNETEKIIQASDNLPVLWRDANKSMEELARNIREAAERENEIRIAPQLDETAMQKFRNDLRRAIDTARKDVNTRGVFVVGPEGIREITNFENAVRRTVGQVRRIASEINRITQATARLRYAWAGMVSTIRGVPGWIRQIRQVTYEVAGDWDRLHTSINRVNLALDDAARKVLRFGDTVQAGVIRGWIELDRAANGALTRIGNGVDRVQAGFNRLSIEVDRVAATGLNRLGQGIARVQTMINRLNLESENGARRLVSAWHSVREAINSAGARLYDFRANTLDMSARWFDIRRGAVLAGDAIADMGRRLIDVRAHVERTKVAFHTMGDVLRRVDWDAPVRGFIRSGNQGIRWGSIMGNVVQGIGIGFRALGTLGASAMSSIGSGVMAAASAIKSGLGNAFDAVGQSISKMASGATSSWGALVTLTQSLMQLIGAIALLGGVSTLLVVLGAAVTAAWATVSAVVAALPGAILLLAGPIAAIMTGLDGIKAAAKTIAPEFDKIKKSVSDTFEKGLTPVFRELANKVFPTLQTGLNKIATSLVGVADSLVKAVSSGPGLAALKGTFENIATAVTGLAPALTDIVMVMLEMGAQRGVFDALTSGLQTFAAEWRKSITELSAGPNVLQQAFRGLDTLLDSVARAFASLVDNGIRAFATAAPGMTAGLDKLTDFFERFDWATLGKAVGDVFEGLGEALDKVPQGTIDAIAEGFARIGQTFQDPAFQTQFASIINAIPTVIGLLDQLMQAFMRIASFVSGLGQVFDGLAMQFLAMVDIMANGVGAIADPIGYLAGDFKAAFAEADRAMAEGQRRVDQGLTDIGATFTAAGPRISAAASASAMQWTSSLQAAVAMGLNGVTDTARLGGDGVGAAITLAMQKAGTEGVVPLTQLPAAAGAALQPLPGAVENAMVDVPTTVKTVLEQLGPVIEGSFNSLVSHAEVGVGVIAEGIRRRAPLIATAFTDMFNTAGAGIEAGFTSVNASVASAMTTMEMAINSGVLRITTQFTALKTEMTTLGISFTNLGTQMVPLGVQLVTFNTNITAMVPSVSMLNTGLLTLTTSLIAGNVAITALNALMVPLNAAMLLLSTNLITVNTNVTLLITSFTLLNTGLILLGTNLTLLGTQLTLLNVQIPLLSTSLTLLNTAFVTANLTVPLFVTSLVLLTTTVTLLLPAIQLLIVALTNLGIAFTALLLIVTTTMQAMLTIITSTLEQIRMAFETAFMAILLFVADAMAAMVEAITRGMADSAAAVQAGCDEMVSILEATVPKFRAAGENMGQALADGLRSKAGAVRAAAQELADAAASAMEAALAIASPSKVGIRIGQFLGLGFAVGIDDSRSDVRRSGLGLVSEVMNVVEQLQDATVSPDLLQGLVEGVPEAVKAIKRVSTGTWSTEVSAGDFGGLTEAVSDALGGWQVVIDANGLAKLVNKANTRRARRG